MNSSDDFINFFNGLTGMDKASNNNYCRTDEEELNDLWEDYTSYVEELKADGYKVLRNSQGLHKVIKA